MEKRDNLGRLGFLLISAGCAIGCGNVWKFPWMVGEYGGGAFVLLYLICLVILGIPVLCMELSIGRASRKSILYTYQALEKPGAKWHIHGVFSLIGNIALMAFYTVVTGWMINYFVKFATGDTAQLGFVRMITNPTENVFYMLVGVIASLVVLGFGVKNGLERISKILMVALFVLMVVLCGHSLTLSGAAKGLKFYLLPDASKINLSVLVAAMNQAFFTLSVGIGAMSIFGSYVPKNNSLLTESINIVVLDTGVALMAGLIMFPACATYGIPLNAGPALLFETMSKVFLNMANGRLWGSLFFLFMVFAALSTELAVCENIVTCFSEKYKWSRVKACLICGVGIAMISFTTALGYSIWGGFHPFSSDSAWLDFWDFIVSNNLLPLGSLVIAVFCCFRFGWGFDKFFDEANEGKGLKVQKWMKPIFGYVVPVLIILLYIYGLVTFKWR